MLLLPQNGLKTLFFGRISLGNKQDRVQAEDQPKGWSSAASATIVLKSLGAE
jgi:hypothetical protein